MDNINIDEFCAHCAHNKIVFNEEKIRIYKSLVKIYCGYIFEDKIRIDNSVKILYQKSFDQNEREIYKNKSFLSEEENN